MVNCFHTVQEDSAQIQWREANTSREPDDSSLKTSTISVIPRAAVVATNSFKAQDTGSSRPTSGGPTDITAGEVDPTSPGLGGGGYEKGPYQAIQITVKDRYLKSSNGEFYPDLHGVQILWVIDENLPEPNHYNVYRDGHLLQQHMHDPDKTEHRSVESWVMPNTDYTYQVKAANEDNTEYATGFFVKHTTPNTSENFHLLEKVSVLPARFPDVEPSVWSKSKLENLIYNDETSVKAYFKETSYGKIDFTGTVRDEVVLPNPSTHYWEIVEGNQEWKHKLLYEHLVELLGGSDVEESNDVWVCPIQGYLPRGFNTGNLQLLSADKMDAPGIIHEIGHRLGCAHSGYWEGPDEIVGPSVEDVSQGGYTVSLYGNLLDPMSTGNMRHFSAYHKEMMGFIKKEQVQVIDAPGTYVLFAVELPVSGIMQLRIPFQGVNNKIFYTLDYRKPLGMFDSAPLQPGESQGIGLVELDNNLLHGVTIRLRWDDTSGDAPSQSDLSNFMPKTLITETNPFHDPYRDITITIDAYLLNNRVQLTVEGSGIGE